MQASNSRAVRIENGAGRCLIRLMRKLVLSALLLSVFPLVSMGQVTTIGQFSYIVENDGATITASTATGAVTFPSELGGYAVKKIGNGAPPIFGFFNTSVSNITIPNSVTNIGDNAFYYCSGLTGTLTIPNSVTDIGDNAFYYCTGLTGTLTIPNSVTNIGEYAFYGCSRLTALTIPDSVASIADGALCGLSEMTNFTLNASNPSFSYSNGVLFNKNQTFLIVAFPRILSGATYTIPNTVTNIGVLAFFGCENLTGITIPVGVINIGNGAFANCSGLTGTLTIPNSVTGIGMYAFNGCTELENITIPATVTSIGDGAFENCSSLRVSSVISQLVANQTINFTAGQQSVLGNPNAHQLYTTSQIQNMCIDDVILTRQVGGGFVLNYDIEKSEDLQSWTTYAPLSLTLTNLPPDKAFIRIKPKQ